MDVSSLISLWRSLSLVWETPDEAGAEAETGDDEEEEEEGEEESLGVAGFDFSHPDMESSPGSKVDK